MNVKREKPKGSAARATLASAFLVGAVATLTAASSRAQQPSPPSRNPSSSSSPSPDSLFEGPEGGRNLVVVGRYLSADDTRLPLAAALLARGAARLRAEGTPDPRAEVLLGETAERLAPKPVAAPEGVGFHAPFDPKLGKKVRVYDGEAFRRALGDLPEDAKEPFLELRERALAGALRARFALPGRTLITTWEETIAWLSFAESVRTPRVAESVSRRLERSAPELARLLLAAGKTDDLTALDRRLTDASQRLEALEPDPSRARRLRNAARAVRKLRGNGTAPFPQEVWLTHGPGAAVVRIEGEIGDLALVVASRPDAPKAAVSRRLLHAPLLPVPGSLSLTADRLAATWLEAETPTRLARVAFALDGSGPVTVTDRDIRAGSSSPRRPSRPPRRRGR
jgi:hypothetical protein